MKNLFAPSGVNTRGPDEARAQETARAERERAEIEARKRAEEEARKRGQRGIRQLFSSAGGFAGFDEKSTLGG